MASRASIAGAFLLDQPAVAAPDHRQRLGAGYFQGRGAIVLPESDGGAIVVNEFHFWRADAYFDFLRLGDALRAQRFPLAAWLAVGRLEIRRIKSEVAVDIVVRPCLRPIADDLEYFARAAGGGRPGRLGCCSARKRRLKRSRGCRSGRTRWLEWRSGSGRKRGFKTGGGARRPPR